ncbi:MAG: hypothetical protein UY92_C0013G0021 [Candidatus Magasanikbacteria bacterium GW2011_GWA2_56_11]|uniref:Uncharacterized protein n=1 Tax=Candidatus Magasanikbacteria bacterium GW2011_GWA2_56_11 TaxID=1619044 RepID=A0A0G2AKP2_9BACT|nr:MAG: hypothetical protein UY92_C0013G0021 [Candidatus Magasanikbacteria bacterium GW2011_GWA2_56_11]
MLIDYFMKKRFKATPAAILLPAFFLHSLIFYVPTYFISDSYPTAAFLVAFFATAVYSIFYFILFEKGYKYAWGSATISIITGLLFGDFFLDRFYPDSLLTNRWHAAYMILIVHNLYLFGDLVRYVLKPNGRQTGSDTEKTRKTALGGALAALSFLAIAFLVHAFDSNRAVEQRLAGRSTYRDRELGFEVSFPVVEMRKNWAEKTPADTYEQSGYKLPGTHIRFYWDASGTRWTEKGYDPYLIWAVPADWWREQKIDIDESKNVIINLSEENGDYLGRYLGKNRSYVFVGTHGAECPGIDRLDGVTEDSKLCGLVAEPDEEIFKNFTAREI